MEPGPSSVISKAVVEDLRARFLEILAFSG